MSAPKYPVRIIFSDIDGTLVHFPKYMPPGSHIQPVTQPPSSSGNSARNQTALYSEKGCTIECIRIPSTTMGDAFMSLSSYESIRQLRSNGVLFVMITGARRETLLKRLAYLPDCDYAIAENGGRIYHFPRPLQSSRLESAVVNDYHLDIDWASRFVPFCGPILTHDTPLSARIGPIWELAKYLATKGYKIDCKDYWSLFRINLGHAPVSDPSKEKEEGDRKGGNDGNDEEDKDEDITRLLWHIKEWSSSSDDTLTGNGFANQEAWSVCRNLDKVDVMPSVSGKGSAMKWVLGKCGVDARDAAVMMDDDNDLPMAFLAQRAYLPFITGQKVRSLVASEAAASGDGVCDGSRVRWFVAQTPGVMGTQQVLDEIQKDVVAQS